MHMNIDEQAKEHEYCGNNYCAICYYKTNKSIQAFIKKLNEQRPKEVKG